MKIYNGYERLPRNYTIATDEYEYTMAYGYLVSGKKDEEAVFDVFFRKIPNNGGYAIMAGVDKVIEYIKKYCNNQMETLYPEIKRILNPHEYYVDGTVDYVNYKNEIIEKTKRLIKTLK